MTTKKCIAKRYASALFNAGFDANVGQVIWDDLQWFMGILTSHEGYKHALNALLPFKVKSAILSETFKVHPLHNMVINMLELLAKNNKFILFEDVCQQYRQLMQNHLGVETLIVETAFPIDEATIAKIVMVLESNIGKKVSIETRIHKPLLGGMVFKCGSQILDCSVRSKVQNLKEMLMHVSI